MICHILYFKLTGSYFFDEGHQLDEGRGGDLVRLTVLLGCLAEGTLAGGYEEDGGDEGFLVGEGGPDGGATTATHG